MEDIGMGSDARILQFFDGQLQLFYLEGNELISKIIRPFDNNSSSFGISSDFNISCGGTIIDYDLVNANGTMILSTQNKNLLNEY